MTLAVSQLVVSVTITACFLWAVHRLSLPWEFREMAPQIYSLNGCVLLIGSILVVWRLGEPMMPWWVFATCFLGAMSILATIGWLWVLPPDHRRRLLAVASARLSPTSRD